MEIIMPQLGETVAEGTIAAWHKQVGEHVEIDEILLDVETDKVATEIPAPATGILSAIHVPEGETVDVGTVLAVIQTENEAAQATPAPAAEAAGDPVSPTPTAVTSTATDVKITAKADPGSAPLSPAVRRLLSEHALEPARITGTGRDGRIKRSDVLAYLDSAGSKPAAPAAPKAIPEDDLFIPFSRMRRVTAEHMVRSKATSPHVLQAVEADFHRVAHCRALHAADWKGREGYSLTYLPFIARAVCLALGEFPHLNASVQDNGLAIHAQVNLAIAVDLDFEGLLAPVIRSAQQLSIAELAQRIHTLSKQARAGNLKPDDLSGGTYTLSNSGSFGTLITAPIINQPQVAILSVDGIRKRPVVISGPDGDTIAIRPVGVLAQSFDHRAVDGAYSAAFLQRLQAILAETDWERELL